MNTQTAVNNLKLVSEALEKEANKLENANTNWSFYLEQMSWEMNKYANDLLDFKKRFMVCEGIEKGVENECIILESMESNRAHVNAWN